MGSFNSVLKKRSRPSQSAPRPVGGGGAASPRSDIARRCGQSTRTYVKSARPCTRVTSARSSDGPDDRLSRDVQKSGDLYKETAAEKKLLIANDGYKLQPQYDLLKDMKLVDAETMSCFKTPAENDPTADNVETTTQWYRDNPNSVKLRNVGESTTDEKVNRRKAGGDEINTIYINDIPGSRTPLQEKTGASEKTPSNNHPQLVKYIDVCFEKAPIANASERVKVGREDRPVEYVDIKPTTRQNVTKDYTKSKVERSTEDHLYENLADLCREQKSHPKSTADEKVAFQIQGVGEASSEGSCEPVSSGKAMSAAAGHSKDQKMPESGTAVVALCDYTAPDSSVLSFTAQQRATLLSCSPEGWWYVSLHAGPNGWVPGNYWKTEKKEEVSAATQGCVEMPPVPPKPTPRQQTAGVTAGVTASPGHSADEDEAWYVGRVSRSECEARLTDSSNQEHCFLVRESTNRQGDWTLSVRDGDRVRHFPIQRTDDHKYFIGQHHFKHLRTIITYYSKHPLFFSDAQQTTVVLGRPVTQAAGGHAHTAT